MKFPHAYHGVKKIFIAELISIAAALVALVAAILVTIINAGNQSLANSATTLKLVSGIASIVVFVIELIGLIQGSKDSREFRIGLWVIIVGIAATLTSAILSSIDATKGLSPILFAVLDTVGAVADFLVVLCILFGISSLAANLGNSEMEERGRKLAFYVILFYIVALIFGLLPGFNGYIVNPGFRLLFTILGIAAVVLEIFVYICTIFYLSRATEMLEE